MSRILVVDDEQRMRSSFSKMLTSGGHDVLTADRGAKAVELVEKEDPDLLVMDIKMPGMDGLEAFRKIRLIRPKLPVIMMTGFGTTEAAIEATKLGAYEYHLKPFDPEAMLRSIASALESVRLMKGRVVLDPSDAASGDAIIGQCEAMQGVYKAIGRVAQTDATVLIRGETGTGKELVARAVYQHSLRAAKPLIVVNCVAIPETLLESELFGHEKGSFTGASAKRIGKFEQANGGTILLDEIGDMPLTIQSKILRVLQARSFERVGGESAIKTDVRVIAATNRNLEKAIAEGKFREDLYHRLNVFTIDLPALRNRVDDIPRLAAYFLDRFADELKIENPIISSDAMEHLKTYKWSGNVRELEHCIHRAMIFTRGYPIQDDDVKRALERPTDEIVTEAATTPDQDALRSIIARYLKDRTGELTHTQMLESVDRLLVAEALKITSGNQTHAAKRLGLTRPTLQAKMAKYGLRRRTEVDES
jgi:nitrogen regulation protein NR(I)